MQLIMRQSAARSRNFVALLSRRGAILDRDFDEISHRPTGEPLDWHECRRWPALATD